MKGDEGNLFRFSMLLLKTPSFPLRWSCKTLSHTPAHGRVYLRNPQRVGVEGEKVGFFGTHLLSPIFNDLRPIYGPEPDAERFHLVASIN